MKTLIDHIHSLVAERRFDPKLLVVLEIILRDMELCTEYKGVRTVYIFAETSDNQESGFQRADQLARKGYVELALIADGEDVNGFPGYERWADALNGRPAGEILRPLPMEDRRRVNTYSESVALVRYLTEAGFSGAYLTAPPFHILRAFMTVASEAIKTGNSDLIFLSQPGIVQPWSEEVEHSQGIIRGTRIGLVAGELERIRDYENILTAEAVLEYVHNRNKSIDGLVDVAK